MEWNPASLTPAHHHHHLPGSLTVHQLHHVQHPTTMSSALSSAGVSRGGGVVGGSSLEQADDADERRPNTPRNLSPAVLPPDYGDDSLVDENHDDLLVFGYGCKIFRDDERAQWVEDQKHLIPWMGNSDLLIDRYDCRGALTDVSRYEAGSRYDNSQDPSDDSDDLNRSYEQEQLLEQELDEERYKELNEDVDYDEGAYDRAGDYKRLQTAMNGMLSESQAKVNADTRNYAAFQYNYNEQSHDICIGPEPKRLHDEDAPYVKPVGLYIPEEIILPTTMKIHAIIEKTAKFIASQGNQMEIILKTKQSSNPLFDFLNHGGSLNPYYKFLVHAIRSGIYRPPENDDDASGANQSLSSEYSGGEEDSENHTYLHPSLFRASTTSTSALSSIDYAAAAALISNLSSSSKNNAYSMLVSKIKGTDSPDPVSQQQQPHPSTPTTPFSSEYSSYQESSSSNQSVYSMYGYKMSSQQPPAVTVPKPQKKLPSTSDQLIIEKMASYVIKNGANFEVLAKNKSDPRFGFLNPSHEFHWYYLNCKERFKAECTAVVASSEFVNYNSTSGSGNNPSQSSSSSSKASVTAANLSTTIKKSAVAAELAELKRKNNALLARKEVSREKSGGGTTGAETVFSQASLVQNKEKDKPVIRFSSSLSLNSVSTAPSSASGAPPGKSETKAGDALIEPSSSLEKIASELEATSHEDVTDNTGTGKVTTTAPPGEDDEEEEGEIRDAEGDSDSDLCLLEDDPSGTGGGNSTPASEDDEVKIRRRLERKRKAALFLQKLKMAKINAGNIPTSTATSTTKQPSAHISSSLKASQSKPVKTGPSLGDLLNRRLQTTAEAAAAQQERIISAQVPPEITLSDSEDNEQRGGHTAMGNEKSGHFRNSDSDKSTPSSRHSSRSRSRSHVASSSSRTSRKRRKRRRSRSYSSSHSRSSSTGSSSYESSSHSRKKSSKKKRKKKKKKHEKSSRSSHKSKRR